ncbi:RAD4 [Hepatospora eriocheir]|uniref:RAD4 n=1 Tax=Hepatospora eriocheir TaxID=1081669 RepID=A0A1X0QJA0_9MICR|nr:RAD4 [Hepatospora eriocheir]
MNDIDENSDSWDTASFEEVDLTKKKSKVDTTIFPLLIIHSFIEIFQTLNKPRNVPIYEAANEFETRKKIIEERDSIDSVNFSLFKCATTTESDSIILSSNVQLFYIFNLSNIPCRIYFVITKTGIKSFLEYKMAIVNENTTLYNDFVFSVDFDGTIKDQCYYFTRNVTHYVYFIKILDIIKDMFENQVSNKLKLDISCFGELDKIRVEKLPPKSNMLRYHPLYICESLLIRTEIIVPKRPIVGYIGDEAVYLRKNLYKLRSRNYWYFREGKKPIGNCKPYKIINDKEFYALFQVEDIVIENVDEKSMKNHYYIPGFHKNFKPKDCEVLIFNSLDERNGFINFVYEIIEDFKYALPKATKFIKIPYFIFIYKNQYKELFELYKYFVRVSKNFTD